jgi:hypothetical protein
MGTCVWAAVLFGYGFDHYAEVGAQPKHIVAPTWHRVVDSRFDALIAGID